MTFMVEKNKLDDPIDCYLSPAYTPDCILEEYPKITFGICGIDALCDTSFVFASRLLRNIKNIKYVEIKYFPYLSHAALDVKDAGFNHASVYYDKTVEVIKKFLNEKNLLNIL